MKKLFTSLLLLVFGLIVADAQLLKVGNMAVDLAVSKTYTSSDNSAIKSGSVSWDASSQTLTLDNAKIESPNSTCIYASNLGSTASDRYYIYIKGTSSLKSDASMGMRFDNSYLVIYGQSTASLSIEANGQDGYPGIDAEESNLSIWSIGLTIKTQYSKGIWGNSSKGALSFVGTYGNITGAAGAVVGFKSVSFDDCLINTKGAKFVSGTGINNSSDKLAETVQIRPLLRVNGASVRTASSSTSGTNWKWDKSQKALTITGDITASGNNRVVENYGIDDLVIKWEGTPTLSNGSTSSGSVVMSRRSLKFAGTAGADVTKALVLKGYVCLFMDESQECTLTIDNATLLADGSGYGIVGQYAITNFVANNSTIKAKGEEKGGIAGLKSCKMTNCDVNTGINPGVAYRSSLHGFGTTTELWKGSTALWIGVPTVNYYMEVLGKSITDLNVSDVVVDGLTAGKISYDKDSKTLSFDGVKLTAPAGDNNLGLWIGTGSDKTITLSGTNEIVTNGTVFSFSSNITFNGSGNMTCKSLEKSGISTGSGAKVTIDTKSYFLVNAKQYGYYGDAGANDALILKKESTDTYGYRFQGDEGCVFNVKNLELDNMDFSCLVGGNSALGCYFEDKVVKQNGGSLLKGSKGVSFHSIQKQLDITIGGKKLNQTYNDSYSIAVGSPCITAGGEKAVVYDPKTNTLALTKATLEYDGTDKNFTILQNSGVKNLTINLVGENTINTTGYIALETGGGTTTNIRGNGKLNAISSSWYAVRIGSNSTLDIRDNAELNAQGNSAGIANNGLGNSNEKLVIGGKAIVKAKGISSVQRLNSIKLEDDIMLLRPNNAVIDQDGTGWGVFVDGKLTSEEVIFADKSLSAINAVELDPNADVKDIYDLSGRKAETARPGLNIIRMNDGTVRKVMVK